MAEGRGVERGQSAPHQPERGQKKKKKISRIFPSLLVAHPQIYRKKISRKTGMNHDLAMGAFSFITFFGSWKFSDPVFQIFLNEEDDYVYFKSFCFFFYPKRVV
jgi:hypothetical protein